MTKNVVIIKKKTSGELFIKTTNYFLIHVCCKFSKQILTGLNSAPDTKSTLQ